MVVLAWVLLLSATAKAAQPGAAMEAVSSLGLRRGVAAGVVSCAAAIELVLAVALAYSPGAFYPAIGVTILFTGFAVLGAYARATKRRIECGCFGPIKSTRLGWVQIIQLPAALGLLLLLSVSPPAWDLSTTLGVLFALEVSVAAAFIATSARHWHSVRRQRLSLAAGNAFNFAVEIDVSTASEGT